MTDVVDVDLDRWQLWRALRSLALAEAPDAFGSTLAQWTGSGDTEQRWRDRRLDVAYDVVLVNDGEPVGMVRATTHPDQDGVELTSLWVAPSARG